MHIRVLMMIGAVLVCVRAAPVQAQQSIPPTFNDTYESAFAKARAACAALWSDHAFDPLRDKVPLGEEKPTFAMLKNTKKLNAKDRPLADLAIKTLENCRVVYAPVYAMLPPQVSAMIPGVERRQDAIVAELYGGKITFGEYNVAMNRLTGELSAAFSGIPAQDQSASAATAPANKQTASSSVRSPTPIKPEQAEKKSAALLSETRLALVVGNSNYVNLPKLANPANDARSISDLLIKMGYKTRLLLDASEQNIRREVRQFASDSAKADVALVFYAGHGAQVNGNNYLIPVDMDIPRTEVDIQFGGLKIDDLVNSIGSNTKIVFLDACRDNPVLFKNLVKGRGSSPSGLAPASSSSLEQKPGGGVFIAYATDAGAVADDGNGKHSPFTQALLRNIQKPISIDDMFSLVTKEVRLVTKNAQRPYKYASLENIVCVAPNCSSSPAPQEVDVIQESQKSEAEELQIALQTKNTNALETYLQNHSDSVARSEILGAIGDAKRSEFTEWTLYEIGNKHNPQYVQLSSVQKLGDRGTAKTKILVDQNEPKRFYNKPIPEAAYREQINVYDCNSMAMATAEDSIFSASNELLFHYKWGDPKYLNISAIGVSFQIGSVGAAAKNIVCNADFGTPLISKKQLAEMTFISLASTADGSGEIFYGSPQKSPTDPNQIEVTTLIKNLTDHSVKEFFPANVSIPNPPDYRTEVDRILMRCDENKFAIARTEFWNSANQLVRMSALDPSLFKFSEFNQLSPFATLQQISCQQGYGGIGVRLAKDNDLIAVAEVFDGSPAAKAGILKNDIITHIDNQPVSELSAEQSIERMRGPANTNVALKISRKGQDRPIELSITREKIQMKSTEAH